MEIINEIFRALGMTLIHSLWQGAVVAVLVLFLLGFAGKSNARFRFAILFSGLVLLLAGFILTFILVYSNNHGVIRTSDYALFATVKPDYPLPALNLATLLSRILLFLEPLFPFLAIGWCIGFLFIGIHTTGSALLYRRNIRRGLIFPDNDVRELFNKLQQSMRLSGIRLRISYQRISPMVSGMLKPLIILPAAAIAGLSTEQVRAIMIHELAHIKRLDHILIVIEAAARQVLFFHPLLWILIPEIDRERENCCDDFVVNRNNNPINYIKALAMIQEMNIKNVVPANALTGKSNHLLNRMMRIIKPEMKHSATFRFVVILLFLATIGISAMSFVIKEQREVKTQTNDFVKQDPEKKKQQDPVATAAKEGRDPEKKKIKVIVENDTIREMIVNGKPVGKKEMENYADEIRKMQQELENSQIELQEANKRLREAQIELDIARRNMEGGEQGHQWGDLNRQLMGALSQTHDREQFDLMMNNKEFGEEMKKAGEEAQKAFEQSRSEQMKYWREHQDEFRKEMEKAREEAKKAFEEMKKDHKELNSEDFEFHFNFDGPMPPMPPVFPPVPHGKNPQVPHVEVPVIPHADIPPAPHIEIPESPEAIDAPEIMDHNDQSADPDQKDDSVKSKESLDSKLREMEE